VPERATPRQNEAATASEPVRFCEQMELIATQRLAGVTLYEPDSIFFRLAPAIFQSNVAVKAALLGTRR
jgi:hypothetical protein